MTRYFWLLILLFCWQVPALQAGAPTDYIEITPASIELNSDRPAQQVVVTLWKDGQPHDITHAGAFETSDSGLARVNDTGLVQGLKPGEASLSVTSDGLVGTVSIHVGNVATPRAIDFERDVQPLLTRFACNSGGCHGKQRGQNGFQLSLLGFDSDFDYGALTKQSRSRRITLTRPEESLLLAKPSGRVPHGGGIRVPEGSEEYNALLHWIESGAPRQVPDAPALKSISVFPEQRNLLPQGAQQLAVTAHYTDGSARDITRLATFQSNESAIADVENDGVVHAGQIVGEAAIMARYQGMFALFTASIPRTEPVDNAVYAALPVNNFIDELVWARLQRLNLQPSPRASDSTYLRRVYVDIIGRLPTADEARTYLDDPASNKRAQLVDRLLDDPEYASHWSNKWVDLLRPNPYRVGIKATFNYDAWIRDAFRRNQPYDEFVRELITATGGTFSDGNTTLFRDRREPEEIITLVSQLFLGIRLECAKCHHHPFEVYGQEDYYALAAYFGQIGRKGTGLSPPISGSEEFVFNKGSGEVRHPLTGEVLAPKALFGESPPLDDGTDRRQAFAEWLTSPKNPYFAQTMANRVWTDMLGRGLVEPVDDFRATNPSTNKELLAALGRDFAEQDYDIKALIRRIAGSAVYALSSAPIEENLSDSRYFSRSYRHRLRAEVLYDSVMQITGEPESFSAMPPGASSKDLWTHRIDSLFLDSFGRPDPNQDPPCERDEGATVVQMLHMMNAQQLANKIHSDNGTAHQLAESDQAPAEIVETLYLATYSRRPSEEEMAQATGFFEASGENRRQSVEDLMWALMNTPEFLLRD